MTAPVLAYEFVGLTFCEPCALQATQMGFLISGQRLPQTMDEAIASLALWEVETGQDIETPVATYGPKTAACENCGTHFPKVPVPAAEEDE